MDAMNRSAFQFYKLLQFNASLLLAMSLQRLVLFLLVVRHWIFGADNATVALSFFTGVRFDLCVLGFINIPVLLLVWTGNTHFIVQSQNPILKFARAWLIAVYLGTFSLWIHVLAFLDLLFFAKESRRLTFSDIQQGGWSFVGESLQRWGGVFFFSVVTLYVLLWLFRSLYILYKVRITETLHPGPKPPAWGWVFGVILPFLAVAFAARGTWTPHHLAMEHAELSQIQALNHLALSPLWAFDKKF